MKKFVTEARGILKRIDYTDFREDSRIRNTGITLENAEVVFGIDDPNPRKAKSLFLIFHDIVFPDSIGHRVEYFANYRKTSEGIYYLQLEELGDLDLERKYRYRNIDGRKQY